MLAYQKQPKRDLQYLKLSRIIRGHGLIHILLQCQLNDETINALQEMGLTTEEEFVNFPDEIKEFKKKVTFDKVDHLVAAATWMKENSNIPIIHYDTAFTDEVMTSQLKALDVKRAAEKAEKERKDYAQLIRILSLCEMSEEEVWNISNIVT